MVADKLCLQLETPSRAFLYSTFGTSTSLGLCHQTFLSVSTGLLHKCMMMLFSLLTLCNNNDIVTCSHLATLMDAAQAEANKWFTQQLQYLKNCQKTNYQRQLRDGSRGTPLGTK